MSLSANPRDEFVVAVVCKCICIFEYAGIIIHYQTSILPGVQVTACMYVCMYEMCICAYARVCIWY